MNKIDWLYPHHVKNLAQYLESHKARRYNKDWLSPPPPCKKTLLITILKFNIDTVFERRYIFHTILFGIYVRFRGCILVGSASIPWTNQALLQAFNSFLKKSWQNSEVQNPQTKMHQWNLESYALFHTPPPPKWVIYPLGKLAYTVIYPFPAGTEMSRWFSG